MRIHFFFSLKISSRRNEIEMFVCISKSDENTIFFCKLSLLRNSFCISSERIIFNSLVDETNYKRIVGFLNLTL